MSPKGSVLLWRLTVRRVEGAGALGGGDGIRMTRCARQAVIILIADHACGDGPPIWTRNDEGRGVSDRV